MDMENAAEMQPADMMEEKPMEDPPKEEEPKEEEPAEEPKADENEPMMAAEAVAGTAAAGEALGLNAFGGKEDESDNSIERKPVRTTCCCCLCNCSYENTEGIVCCCCLPIKTGVVLVGMVMFFIAFVQFTNAYYQFANITVPWWKPVVTLLLFSPGFIGVCFFIGWYTKDCTRTRATLTAATIQGLTSYILILIW